MEKIIRIIIVVALIAAVGIVFALKQKDKASVSGPAAAAGPLSNTKAETKPEDLEVPKPAEAAAKLPRLVDLGAKKCIPCKMMAPILEELKKEYASKFEVEFIDVWKDGAAGEKYGIKLIPTQIFYDPNGKELFRHEGLFSKEDILGKWKELGVEFKK